MATLYRGYQEGTTAADAVMVVVCDTAGTRSLAHPASRLIGEFTRRDFRWGYQGVGPRLLARAMLTDHLGRVPHQRIYEAFEREIVANWPYGRSFTYSSSEIESWLRRRRVSSWPEWDRAEGEMLPFHSSLR